MDHQADRVIDRIMVERQKALNAQAQREGAQTVAQVEETAAVVEAKTTKPAPKGEIVKIIEEKGEVSVKDLKRLIARDVRRGL